MDRRGPSGRCLTGRNAAPHGGPVKKISRPKPPPPSWQLRRIHPVACTINIDSMFIDEAIIRIKGGDGGNGCMAFRREKFVPRGGPSGGDGGRGGDIVMESSERHNTLVHFRFNPEYKGERGRHGEGSNCTGRDGESVILKVPVGTIVYDNETGERLH